MTAHDLGMLAVYVVALAAGVVIAAGVAYRVALWWAGRRGGRS